MATLLVVDDDVRIQRTLRRLLCNEGYGVLVAGNGAEALALFESATPDLVLLDLMLPDLDGLEICRQIRRVRCPDSCPVFAVTARSEPEDRRQARAVGVDEFFAKPFDPTDLLECIREHLSCSAEVQGDCA